MDYGHYRSGGGGGLFVVFLYMVCWAFCVSLGTAIVVWTLRAMGVIQ